MASVEEEIHALAGMDLKTLRVKWQRLYHNPTPRLLSRDLLTRMIACKMREQVYGGLKPAVRRKLKSLMDQLEKHGDEAFDVAPTLRPGTRLIREWNNKTYVVHVRHEGFEFQDRHYASLSEIAREITGARWSGPRFFGLVKPRKPKAAAAGVSHG